MWWSGRWKFYFDSSTVVYFSFFTTFIFIRKTMLCNQINFQNKSILFIDNYGMEKNANNILRSILLQQNNLEKTTFLQYNDLNEETLNKITSEILVLPLVSEILISYKPAFIFKILNKFKVNKNIKQIFIWVTKRSIQEDFVVPFLEYMTDQVITIKNSEELSILTRKTGGLIANKAFKYKILPDSFEIEPFKASTFSKSNLNEQNPLNLGTFKIDLEEEEMIARNALKLPYEKAKDNEASIIYTPDETDDFDDEDPDEDLTI